MLLSILSFLGFANTQRPSLNISVLPLTLPQKYGKTMMRDDPFMTYWIKA